MGRLALYVLTGIVILFSALAGAALAFGLATWEQASAFVLVAATALYTYLRAEPKEQKEDDRK